MMPVLSIVEGFLTGMVCSFYLAVLENEPYKPLSRLPQGGEAKTLLKPNMDLENRHSHQLTSPLPIILSGATRSLGSEDEGGKVAKHAEGDGGIGPFDAAKLWMSGESRI